MRTIGSIIWPSDAASAVRLYLSFLVAVLDVLEIRFEHFLNDPLLLTKRFLLGEISEEERADAAAEWWAYLDENKAIQEFRERRALMARLAICLLSIKEKDSIELGENLSWFFEVLGFLGVNLDAPIDLMENYFSFKR